MDKSIKQIADSLGISKQRVYRYIKQERITSARQDGSTLLYDDTAQKRIITHFVAQESSQQSKSEAHHKTQHDTVIETLKEQLVVKDHQIEQLQLLLSQEQSLNAGLQNRIIALEDKTTAQNSGTETTPRRWWQRRNQASK